MLENNVVIENNAVVIPVSVEAIEATRNDIERQLVAYVVASFSGSQATSSLYEHFSSLTTESEVLDHYSLWCFKNSGWLRKGQVSGGKSELLSGWKALRRYAAKLILTESNQWLDTLTEREISVLVGEVWETSENERAKRFFRNATVFNNLASYKSSVLAKKKKAAVDAADPEVVDPEVVEPEISVQEIALQEIREESKVTMQDYLAALQREITSVKNDPKATKTDYIVLVDYVSDMLSVLLSK